MTATACACRRPLFRLNKRRHPPLCARRYDRDASGQEFSCERLSCGVSGLCAGRGGASAGSSSRPGAGSGALRMACEEGLYGEPSVVIDLQMQRAEVFIGGQYAGWSVVATGKEGFGTPAGEHDP